MTADSTRYTPTLEPIHEEYREARPHDVKKVKTAKYRDVGYLLNHLEAGELCIGIRGKLCAFAAGYVRVPSAVFCSLY